MNESCYNPFAKIRADIASTIQEGGKVTASHVNSFLSDVYSPSGVRLAQLVADAVDSNNNSELTEARQKYISEILKTFEGHYG